jgi:trk system potassium uptake protein TrkH
MNYPLIKRIIGIMLMMFSATLLIPVIVSIIFNDNNLMTFVYSFFIILVVASILYFPNMGINDTTDIKVKEGFLIVVSFWVVLSFFGSIPFIMDAQLSLNFADALFESISGWTTTGATVITNIDDLSPSILMYRQMLQWLGGMGIVVLALAILPMLGIGGMQLYKAESTGPIKDNKISPRIAETAKNLWSIYVGLTLLCAVAYYAAGMNLFDAIAHSFSTIAIGGFSTHNLSIAYFNNPLIEIFCMIFMFLSALNFILHFMSFRHKDLSVYLKDSEFKSYVFIIFLFIFISFMFLNLGNSNEINFRHLMFQIISFTTTSGFTSASFNSWPSFIITMLITMSFIGACTGSTGGGIKVMRVAILFKLLKKEMLRILHPTAEVTVKINQQTINDELSNTIYNFFIFYVVSYIILSLILMFSGLDITTSLTAVASCINNLGPASGIVAENYAPLSTFAKYILSFAMILGRLEIYTLLIIFTPYFWKF